MLPDATSRSRRRLLLAGAAILLPSSPRAGPAADDSFEGDPFGSLQWPELRREYLGRDARAAFDPRVVVRGPALAEDPMNVPIGVSAEGLQEVERIVVLVDRNPIRKVLDFEPLAAATRPALSFRFKLEQASPVRAAVRTRDGLWHVGGTVVESSGGGCTVPGATRRDGSWTRTLGQVSGRLFEGGAGAFHGAAAGAGDASDGHRPGRGHPGLLPAAAGGARGRRRRAAAARHLGAGQREPGVLVRFPPAAERADPGRGRRQQRQPRRGAAVSRGRRARAALACALALAAVPGTRAAPVHSAHDMQVAQDMQGAQVAQAARDVAGRQAGQAAPPAPEPRADAATLDYRLAARALAPGVYVVEGAHADFARANGCNIINTGFIVGRDGVLVVNTGPSRRYGEQLRTLIARTTPVPVTQVLHLNLHPDYFLGNQAFADVPRAATATTLEGMRAEARAYEGNLYRACGDWMKGTEALLPDRSVVAGPLRLAGRRLELRELRGHTASDSRAARPRQRRAVRRRAGVRAARAHDAACRTRGLAGEPRRAGARAVPDPGAEHSPVTGDARGIGQTRRYLQWLDRGFTAAAERGLELHELLAQPVPDEFRGWAAFDTEYPRNVVHLYTRYEARALRAP